jgi:hypothetical protein
VTDLLKKCHEPQQSIKSLKRSSPADCPCRHLRWVDLVLAQRYPLKEHYADRPCGSSRQGVFVVKTKNMQGWFRRRTRKWTQVIYRKTRFQNPIRQNYKHQGNHSCLESMKITYGVVAFVGSAESDANAEQRCLEGARITKKYILSHRTQ